MRGDFSVLKFDPHEHDRAVARPADGVLRNISGVLHQQGRVTTDADFTEGELIELGWNGQAGRDIIGAGVCAVPAAESDGFRVVSAKVVGGEVRVMLQPGRAWADGILTRLPGEAPDAKAPVERAATYFGPPLSQPLPTPSQIGDATRDAVILEVSEEELHGFQYPERLIEPALGGPDTSERAFVNFRVRLLRLADGEDCDTIRAKLRDDPSSKGRLTASLAPAVVIGGDCPVVGGGGYTGFEHNLYRVEIADVPDGAPARFKWSQWNGGLVGRGRFDSTVTPARVTIDAGRAAIVNSGLTEFYLEALRYDDLAGAWTVAYAAVATLNTDHDLELAAPPAFGTFPSTTDSVFFRLWNGVADIASFPDVASPVELRDGIRLAFDAPAAGNYRAGDYWTFAVRAGEIANPQILVDDAPPTGVVCHRVPLAEIDWTSRQDTQISGMVEDCRRQFRPLTNQKICCTFLVGDGVSSFGDFNSLEEAALHLPAAGGELCLLPGVHRANLRLDGRRNVKIHGCNSRTMVLPRDGDARTSPVLHFVDCVGIEVCDLDLVTYDGMAVRVEGRKEDACRDVRIHDNRMIARTNAVRAENAAELVIAGNRLHLLDTVDGRATISVAADDVLIERNTLLLLPFVDTTPEDPEVPDDDPTRDPADPCARPQILYRFPLLVRQYALSVWSFLVVQLVPKQPYRALGGIHVRAGSERVRILENRIAGGAGNGVTLGGDMDPADPPPVTDLRDVESVGDRLRAPSAAVNVAAGGQFLALMQDESGRPLSDVDVYLESGAVAADRSDAKGMASIKASPGAYTLDVSPQFRVVRVAEARDEGVLVNAVTLSLRGAERTRGFLHEITIEANDVSRMGLSGIGFALRAGTDVKGATTRIPSGDAKGALLAHLDAAIQQLALTPLLRATDMVRDLVVLNNRLHHNLLNPFTKEMLAEAQFIGRGGVSLGVVDSAVISGNHVEDNGPRAVDPACGIFVGYGDDVQVADNVLSRNGADTDDFESNRRAGIRGGVYVRFAGALTKQLSSSSGRNTALRVHGNRVDQPAGRALTAFAFGPVSVVDNHLNSERTGLFGFVDAMFGGVLVFNLGGFHRLLARLHGNKLLGGRDVTTAAGRRFAAVAEQTLPGGETLFDDNYVRLGVDNRSIISQGLASFDDLGYSSNTAAVYRGDPFFANALLFGDSVRATSSRLREDVTRTISLLTRALRMNMTALNQADHCIVAQPSAGSAPLPTVDKPNQVLDFATCARAFAEPSDVTRFLVAVLAASADRLGGTLSDTSFSSAEISTLAKDRTARMVEHLNASQVLKSKNYQYEAARMSAKRGGDHPTTVALSAQGQAGADVNRLLLAGAETVVVTAPVKEAGGSTYSGRFVNDRGQGLADHTVELVRANGARVETVGLTDSSGHFSVSFDEARSAALAKEGDLFARVVDLAGKEVLRDKTALRVAADADLETTLVVPVRVVPKSVAVSGTVIFGPSVTPPPPPPPPPSERTPLEKLDITATLRKQLMQGGVRDVEAILETEPRKLAAIVGDEGTARKLIEMAKKLLEPTPTPPTPAVRTSLEKLDIAATMRKQLMQGDVRDVEGILEIDPKKLAAIVGDEGTARKLIEMAKRLLEPTPPPPTPAVRTSLDKLDITAALRKQLTEGGVRDVEGILETDAQKLTAIVGDAATTKRLIEMAKKLLAPLQRHDLSELGIDANLRKKLEDAGFRDAEAVAAADLVKLVAVVGDRAAAAKLIETAKKLVGGTPRARRTGPATQVKPPKKRSRKKPE